MVFIFSFCNLIKSGRHKPDIQLCPPEVVNADNNKKQYGNHLLSSYYEPGKFLGVLCVLFIGYRQQPTKEKLLLSPS